MKPDTVGSYHDAAGLRHEVQVRETHGGWQVLDTDAAARRARVIDTLESPDDGRPQAEAIARDYLASVGSAGRTPGDPIPEQGGSDARNHPRSRPGPRKREARGTALPRAAR